MSVRRMVILGVSVVGALAFNGLAAQAEAEEGGIECFKCEGWQGENNVWVHMDEPTLITTWKGTRHDIYYGLSCTMHIWYFV